MSTTPTPREVLTDDDLKYGRLQNGYCNMPPKEVRDIYEAELTKIRGERDRLREYAQHTGPCDHWKPFAGDPRYIPCTCGLSALLSTPDENDKG